jgi:hypothetical protein
MAARSRQIAELRAALRMAQVNETTALPFKVLLLAALTSRTLFASLYVAANLLDGAYCAAYTAITSVLGGEVLGGEGRIRVRETSGIPPKFDDNLPVAPPVQLPNAGGHRLAPEAPLAAVAVHPSR